MSLSRTLSLVTVVLFIIFAPGPVSAQLPDAPFEEGFKPYGSFEGGNVDSVNLSNLTLNVGIPLVSYTQRGGQLHMGFKIIYKNVFYKSKNVPANCSDSRTCLIQYSLAQGGIQIVPDFPTPYLHDLSTNGSWGSIGEINGTTHPLNVFGPSPSGTSTHSVIAVDGSGFFAQFTLPASPPTPGCPSGTPDFHDVVTDNRGIKETFGCLGSFISAADPNGNKITGNVGSNGQSIVSWTDTLGRTIPVPPIAQSGLIQPGQTTDFTNCTGASATTAAYLWTVPSLAGGSMDFKVCMTTIHINFPNCGQGTRCLVVDGSDGYSEIQSIVLPNKSAWTFQYDSSIPGNASSFGFGNLTQITFPTGGSISYQWPQDCPSCDGSGNLTRTIDIDDAIGPRTSTYNRIASATPQQVTAATDATGNDVVHTFTALLSQQPLGTNGFAFYETLTQYFQGTGSTRNLLKTVQTDYNASPTGGIVAILASVINVAPVRVTTTWSSGQVTKVEKDYLLDVTSGNLTTGYGNVVAEREYDYGSGSPGALLRQTTTTFQYQNSSVYKTNNLTRLPATVTVLDGVGAQRALTTYGYDESPSPPGALGNQTSIHHWLNTTGATLNATKVYNSTGTVSSSKDANGDQTTYAYSSTYSGAYPTTITNALSQATNHAYDFTTGLITSTTDPNSQNTSFTYDSMWRLATATHPDAGVDSIAHQESSFPFTATLTKAINSSKNQVATNIFDGLGRVTQSQITSDPQGTDYTDTAYDALGRASTVSNPHRTCGSDITSSCGTTTHGYDALSQKTSEAYPDGSTLTTAYCGPSTLVTDAAGRWRRSRTDGLGRLVEVDEPNAIGATVAPTGCPGTGEPIFVTSYGYDALGNLTNVLQNGSHPRIFTYDSLSRLLTSANPEVGTITYTYDANGNVLTKKDARAITTTYTYDALNRERTRTYSNGDPTVTTTYDQSACLGLSACQNIGHRTSATDGAGSEAWSYQTDATNHRSVHVDQRTITSSPSNVTKTSTYYLDLAGNVTQAVYPTGRTVNYSYDSADRLSSATDATNGITYATGLKTAPGSTCVASATCYTPQGTFYSLSIGQTSSFNGLNLTHIYNSRLQPQEFKASSTVGNAIDVAYSFVDPLTTKNAGHVYTLTNNLDTTRSQSFTYDQLNRITTAQTTSTHATSPAHCWGEIYSLDAWANLQSIAATANSNYTGCSQESGSTKTADANNHLSGFTYDSSGNTQNDGSYAYTWDGESQLKTAGGVTYLYDGDGRRVAKVGSKLYWYGAGGEILAETDAAGNTQNEYMFFGGKRIAQVPVTGTPIYYVEDLLGTSRVITTSTGTVCYDADFYPYGGERAYTNSCPQNYKFEGKERDTETGNDAFGARYYSNRFGRWLSADWSAVPVAVPYANLTNPQTLNLYAMVSDDPESFADLDGHCAEVISCTLEFGAAGSAFGPPGAVIGALAGAAIGAGLGYLAGKAIDHFVQPNSPPPSTSTQTQPPSPPPSTSQQGTVDTSATPLIVVTPAGDAIPIPDGASGPTSTRATGAEYQGGSGGQGIDARVTGVRIMEPNSNQGGRVSYNNASGQKVDPATGKTVANSDPSAHIPLKPNPPAPPPPPPPIPPNT